MKILPKGIQQLSGVLALRPSLCSHIHWTRALSLGAILQHWCGKLLRVQVYRESRHTHLCAFRGTQLPR